MSINLRWLVSASASCFHAVEALAQGRRLVDECLKALAAVGIQKCHLFIYADNENGMAFWKTIGWTPREELKIVSKNL